MMKEMVAERVVGMAIDVVNDNKEAILGVAVKGIKRIPKNVPYIAAGAVAGATIALGGVYVYNKIQEKKEEKMTKMEEELNRKVAEILAELNK